MIDFYVGLSNGLKSSLIITLIVSIVLIIIGSRVKKLEAADAPKTRDVRLDTSKLADQGVVFTESKDAIAKCLKEFHFI